MTGRWFFDDPDAVLAYRNNCRIEGERARYIRDVDTAVGLVSLNVVTLNVRVMITADLDVTRSVGIVVRVLLWVQKEAANTRLRRTFAHCFRLNGNDTFPPAFQLDQVGLAEEDVVDYIGFILNPSSDGDCRFAAAFGWIAAYLYIATPLAPAMLQLFFDRAKEFNII